MWVPFYWQHLLERVVILEELCSSALEISPPLFPKAILKPKTPEERPYSGEAGGFTDGYQEKSMYIQLLYRGYFKTSAVALRESMVSLLNQTRVEGNQFSVAGMKLHAH